MNDMNHVRKGRQALKDRRTGALNRLLKVKAPDERQQAEIETLKGRVKR
jgi:hypothetical protein